MPKLRGGYKTSTVKAEQFFLPGTRYMFIRRPLPFQKNTVKMRSLGLVLHFTFFSFASSANIYNPSFQGGTGCEAGKLINTSSCLSTPNKARQATNGAGGNVVSAYVKRHLANIALKTIHYFLRDRENSI